MRLKHLYIFILALAITSCGAKKATSTADDLAVSKVILGHNNVYPDFKTLAARIQVVYEDDTKSQSITTSLRIEKDKNIWIKASLLGITISKVLITPDRVSFYETVGRTYFDGDFKLLSDFLGTELTFQQVQALLLGQSIFDLKRVPYSSEIQIGKYKLSPKKQDQDFIYSVLLNVDNFKVNAETLSQPLNNRLLTLRYGDYQTVNGNFYPTTIALNTSEGESKTSIDINYKKIDVNADVSFPFDIPSGYEEITLDK